MKKIFLILSIFILSACQGNLAADKDMENIPHDWQDYEVAEVTGESCEVDSDCETPMDYMIRSNCPYTSICLENKCTVICPQYWKEECNNEYEGIFFPADNKYLSEAEIGEELIFRWLSVYKDHISCKQAWLEDFKINQVEHAPNVEVDEGFMVTVNFDVKPEKMRVGMSDWLAGNGVMEGDWVNKKFLFVNIVKKGDKWKIVSLGTGP